MNKKQIILIILMTIIYLLSVGYLSGILIQAYQSSIEWQTQPMLEGVKFKIEFNIAEISKALLTKEGIIAWAAISIFIAGIIYLIIMLKGVGEEDEQNFKYSGDGTYGTARWMTDKEKDSVFKTEKIKTAEGIILGKPLPKTKKVVTLPQDTYYNKHVLIAGGTGAGKSRKYVRNNILSLIKTGQSMIITDPKGELYRDTAIMLKNEGYNVKIFNLVNPIHSDRWNPLSEVVDDLSAQLFSDVVITNTRTSVKVGGDPFWDRAEMNLLKALTLYVTIEYKGTDKATMETLYSLLSCGDSSIIDSTFKSLKMGHPAKAPFNIYAQASANVKTGVVIGLGTRLQVFQNKIIQGLTQTNDINLLEPGINKRAYFCIMSDTDTTLNFLSSLFFSFLFIDLVRYADTKPTGKCNPEVNFLLDEFCNIGEIPDFTKKISTVKSRGLNCSIIIQNIPQIQNRYPLNAWQEILSNCDTKLVLGTGDKLTSEYFSELLGETTIKVKGLRKKLGIDYIFDFGTETRSVGKRALLNPDEIMQLSNDKCIVILRGKKPLKLYKLDYTEHPDSKKMIIQPYSQYTPNWSKKWLELEKKGLNNMLTTQLNTEPEAIEEKEIKIKTSNNTTEKYDTAKESNEQIFYIKDESKDESKNKKEKDKIPSKKYLTEVDINKIL